MRGVSRFKINLTCKLPGSPPSSYRFYTHRFLSHLERWCSFAVDSTKSLHASLESDIAGFLELPVTNAANVPLCFFIRREFRSRAAAGQPRDVHQTGEVLQMRARLVL